MSGGFSFAGHVYWWLPDLEQTCPPDDAVTVSVPTELGKVVLDYIAEAHDLGDRRVIVMVCAERTKDESWATYEGPIEPIVLPRAPEIAALISYSTAGGQTKIQIVRQRQ